MFILGSENDQNLSATLSRRLHLIINCFRYGWRSCSRNLQQLVSRVVREVGKGKENHESPFVSACNSKSREFHVQIGRILIDRVSASSDYGSEHGVELVGYGSYGDGGFNGLHGGHIQHHYAPAVPVSQHVEVTKPVPIPVVKNVGKFASSIKMSTLIAVVQLDERRTVV